jgi:Skp family chaperone for outer membrane proteins
MDIAALSSHASPRMTRPALLISALLAQAYLAGAAERFAVVAVTDIYQALPSTQAMKQEIEAEKQAVLENFRMKAFRELLAEIETIKNGIADQAGGNDEEAARKLVENYTLKRQQLQAMQADIEQFQAQRTKEINQKMVTAMRASLARITETAQRIAEEGGFDLLLDRSGETNTGVPALLYVKDTPDLTQAVLAALWQNESSSGSEPTADSDADTNLPPTDSAPTSR